jgi:hypothetical protein
MPTMLEQITAFHQLRQNFDWPEDLAEQQAAFAKALDYQQAFYPVRSTLTPQEAVVFTNALALLALQMVNAPPVASERAIKKLKEQGSSGAAIETEYESKPSDPYPLITAMLAPLAPVKASGNAAVRISRLQR